MTPTRMAIVYSAASMVIGPLVAILGYSLFTRAGGDYCDSVYFFPDGSVDPSRTTEFRNAKIFQVVGAGVMIAVGGCILTSFATNRDEKR